MSKKILSIKFYFVWAIIALMSASCGLADAKNEKISDLNANSVNQPLNSDEKESVSEKADSSNSINTGLCANKYFPVSDQAKWRYKVTSTKGSGEYTYTIGYQSGAGKFEQIQDIIRGSAAELKIDWLCLPEGLRTAKYGQLTGNPGIGMNLDSKGASGITLPKDTDWQTGKKWTSEYVLSGTFEMKPIKGNVTGKAVLNHEILAMEEKVRVAAGEYAAAKVKTVVSMQASFNNRKLPAESIVMMNWYAPHVGLIKQDVTGTMGKMTMDYLGK